LVKSIIHSSRYTCVCACVSHYKKLQKYLFVFFNLCEKKVRVLKTKTTFLLRFIKFVTFCFAVQISERKGERPPHYCTMCFTDLGKIHFAMVDFLSSSQFLLLPQLPHKMKSSLLKWSKSSQNNRLTTNGLNP
jgi:hypothetical protein